MKHKYIIAAFGCAALLTMTSCGEDFLYKAPQGSIDQNALENEVGVDLLVISTYATLTENDWGASPFNWTFGGMYGGDANKGSEPGDQSVLNEMEMYNTTSSNGYVSEKWRWTYKGIKRANTAFQVLENADVSETMRNSRRGELLFLRSLFYFESVKVFGPYIPYIDASIEDNDPKIHNDKDIYPNIISDLDEAIALLPETHSEIGRPNVWAAKALKAKVLMQKGDLAAAKPILLDVITNGQTTNGLRYGLENNLNANWDALRENGKEAIFAVQFSNETNDNGNSGMSLCYPNGSGPGGCCGFYQPSFELVNSFQVDANGLPFLNKEYQSRASVSVADPSQVDIGVNDASIAVDPRLDFSVGRSGIPYKDWGMPAKDWVRDITNGGIFMPKKHVFSKAESDAGQTAIHAGWAPGSTMNIQYLSLRDMILMYAECLANDGELAAAMEQVNIIRARAALEENIVTLPNGNPAANYRIAVYPSSHAAYTDKATCIAAVRMERKLELAMEGSRWFDLQRWGGDYMAQELRSYIDYERQYIPKFAGASSLPAAKTMFPVPDSEVQTMGNDENGNPYLAQPSAWR